MTPQMIAGPEGGGKKDDGWGARGFIQFGLICVLILGGGLGGWAATASLSGAVIAMGQLRVETNRQVVQHPDGGVVAEILARDGDVVNGGDVLIRLDDVQLRSELIALESQLFEIIARLGRLTAVQTGAKQIDFDAELLERSSTDPEVDALMRGQKALFDARNNTMAKEVEILNERKLQLEDQIRGTEAEITALQLQTELIGKELKDMRELLRKGLVPASRVLSLEREQARLLGQAGNLTAQVAQLRGQITEISVQQSQMETTVLEEAITESRELGFRRLEIQERRIALNQRMDRLEIRAPRSGEVIDSTIFALKSVVRPAEPILFIIPNDSSLVVDARVEPTDVDVLFRGQESVLRFSALNTRTTPEIFGEIVNVSPDVITDEASGLQFYKTEVKLKDGELEKLEDQELVAGMPVEVYIQTGSRTPIAYLMKPITDYFNRAWREN